MKLFLHPSDRKSFDFCSWVERPEAIAHEIHRHVATKYRDQKNLFTYESISAPRRRQLGAPRKIPKTAENSLIEYLNRHPWANQKEMSWFLWEEWGILVHQSTIPREIAKRAWSRKKSQRYGRRNEELRENWHASMNNLTANRGVSA